MLMVNKDELKQVFERYLNAPHVRLCGEMAIAIDTCIQLLDNARAIDAVPVVRCKDCKRFLENKEALVTYCKRELKNLYVKPDDFCSYGERKDGVEL